MDRVTVAVDEVAVTAGAVRVVVTKEDTEVAGKATVAMGKDSWQRDRPFESRFQRCRRRDSHIGCPDSSGTGNQR